MQKIDFVVIKDATSSMTNISINHHKDPLLCLRQFLASESPLKMNKMFFISF